MIQKMKFIKEVVVEDPDSQAPVRLGIYKTEGGGMVGIDTSFLANSNEPVWSPFDYGVELEEEEE
jgi:hypothetical protein